MKNWDNYFKYLRDTNDFLISSIFNDTLKEQKFLDFICSEDTEEENRARYDDQMADELRQEMYE